MDFFASPWLMPNTHYNVTLNGSIAKDTLGLLLDGSFNGVSTGHPEDDFILGFTTGPATNLTVLGNDTAPPAVDQGQQLVPMLVADLIADNNQLLFQSITVDKTGTCPDSEVGSVSLWLDANSNARWDLADTPLGYATFSAGSATFDLPGIGLIVGPQKVDHLFVLVNVTKDALVGHTVGVKVSSESAVSTLGATVKMPIKPLASFNATVGGDITPPNVTSAAPKGNNIALNTSIVVTFSEPMNWTSVESSLKISPQESFDFVVSGYSAVFTPKTPYKYGTTYTVTLLGSVARDTSNNLLDGNKNGISEGSPTDDYTWTFSTPALPAGDISGNVVDDQNAAMRNVTVTIGQKTASTDVTGKYAISSVPTGKYDVTFVKAGYQTFKASNVEIKTGGKTWLNVTVTLLAGSITGIISDSSGKGIEGATVEVKEISGKSTTTDAAGAYTFTRIPVGNYTVVVSKSDYKPTSGQVTVKNGQASTLDLKLEKTQEEQPSTSPLLYVSIALGVLLLIAILYLIVMGGRRKKPSIEEEGEETADEEEKKEEEGEEEKGKEEEDKEKKDEEKEEDKEDEDKEKDEEKEPEPKKKDKKKD
jgi:hypothetical protein